MEGLYYVNEFTVDQRDCSPIPGDTKLAALYHMFTGLTIALRCSYPTDESKVNAWGTGVYVACLLNMQ